MTRTFVDLGRMPLANSYLTTDELDRPEPAFPLHARVCERCWLVQLDAIVAPEAIFRHYAYFSSMSATWVEHARRFATDAIVRLGLTGASRVIEVASNDGYLLQHFRRAGIPVLGVEPAANVAAVAIAAGIPTEVRFFGAAAGEELRARGLQADLVVGNNVLAHVPDLHGFVRGLARVLAPDGVLSLEFPHLLRLVEQGQFDTIYHEHYSYFSLLSAEHALRAHGLRVFDVAELSTHGGSLRLWCCLDGAGHREAPAVAALRGEEARAGLDRPETYDGFQARADDACGELRRFLAGERAAGRRVAAYGAAAKGNTLLNAAGIGTDDIACVVDRSPHKQGRFLPGSRLPILAPEALKQLRPGVLLVLAWNLLDEIVEQVRFVREWGCRFAVPIPRLQLLD